MKFSDDYRPRGRSGSRLPADLDWSDVYADAARMEEEAASAVPEGDDDDATGATR